jgi:hypothetical protein
VNQGGEQGHDDYGLPPVDIEIPDDARELYRDVQAYHRELRALRRHQRSMRWRAPFRRSGIALPLLAGCLIAALVTVMISAMLAANPYMNQTRPNAGRSSSSSATAPNRSRGGTGSPTAAMLPQTTISLAGTGRPVALRTLRGTVLAIVPVNCRCDAAIRQLLTQAQLAGIAVYLVAQRGSKATMLSQLASLVSGMKASRVATDNRNVLTSAYRPVGLTALLIDSHGLVTVDPSLSGGSQLEKQLKQLKPAS